MEFLHDNSFNNRHFEEWQKSLPVLLSKVTKNALQDHQLKTLFLGSWHLLDTHCALKRWLQFELCKVLTQLDIDILSIQVNITLKWMPGDLVDKSQLVQVMAWCRHAPLCGVRGTLSALTFLHIVIVEEE